MLFRTKTNLQLLVHIEPLNRNQLVLCHKYRYEKQPLTLCDTTRSLQPHFNTYEQILQHSLV